MDYKDTLKMPQTDFPMRGNLPENEVKQRQVWEEMDLYNKMKEKNKDGKPFVLHDGPPYANGNIHVGHSLNKIIKDFINRYKFMMGYDVTYIPGWDTHGLPTEQAVTNSGVDRKSMSKVDFRKLCLEFASEQVQKQMDGFKRLNVLADWEHPYITYQKEFEASQIRVFAEMVKKGLIFKGMKPVYWSPSSESALAEAEIEYKDRKDASIYVAFPVKDGNDVLDKGDNLVIWTTTPWTIPGNTGICVNESYDYVKVEVEGKYYVVAKELLSSLSELFEWSDVKEIKTFKGSDIVGLEYDHVFGTHVGKVVCGDHVTLDSGTGLVHTAPSYGADDFAVGKKFGLDMVFGVDDDGKLNKESGEEFAGMYFEDANKAITIKLDELGVLLKMKWITHSYPHDWRTKKPVIFRATSQWFCSIDKIRDDILKEIESNITWHPEWGQTRLYNMIRDRGDWCISRQRAWGVPLPIFYNEDGSEILDYDVIMHVADLFEREGSNIWFEKDAKELLPEGYTNPASPNGNFKKEEDIMDVWFDSGSSHTGAMIARGLPYPADIYLEGSDQYRGWFNSSLITGVAVYGKAPYKTVISHGFTTDGNGQKMSKSLGNGVEPLKLVELHGADILRLWAASIDYTEDMPINDEIIKQVKESYRKIRNTYKFILGNLNGFDYEKNAVKYEDMLPYDKYMMVKLNEYTKAVLDAYEGYNYQEVYKLTNNFVSFDLSNFYLDFTKDILYIESEDALSRRSVQTVLYSVLNNLIRLLAPILPYTSEEVYGYLDTKEASVHLERMPEVVNYKDSADVLKDFALFFEVKEEVNKALEDARNEKLIGSSLEAQVYIQVDGEYRRVLEQLETYLKQLFIVSDVILSEDNLPKIDKFGIKVVKSDGEKCERCWNYVPKTENGLCPRCQNIIK